MIPKKTKKPYRRPLAKRKKSRADTLFSLQVRAIGICELKGKDDVRCGGRLQCAHIVGRARHALRWDRMNALSLCAGHHVYYTHNPENWRDIIAREFPDKWEYVVANQEKEWDKDINKVLEELIRE